MEAKLASDFVDGFFVEAEQVEEQGTDCVLLKDLRNVAVPRTMSAAATAVSDEHKPACSFRQRQSALQRRPSSADFDLALDAAFRGLLTRYHCSYRAAQIRWI